MLDNNSLFQGLNLTLGRQETALLAGPSGCGKSTLLNCLLGFILPNSGSIRIFGQELTDCSAWRIRTLIAYVPQEPVLGQGEVGLLLQRPFGFRNNRHLQKNLKQIPQLLERLLLPQTILVKEISSLSGGEKQRIALLLALLLDRDLLLLDEASSALDQVAKEAVIGLLREKEQLSILAISHDRDWQGFAPRTIDLPQAQRRTT